jgi:PKD repeat protein/subtilisin family serine protease
MKQGIYVLTICLCLSRAAAQTVYEEYRDGFLYFRVAPEYRDALPTVRPWDKTTVEAALAKAPEWVDLATRYGIFELSKASILPDPTLQRYYKVKFHQKERIEALIREIEGLPYVELAEKAPLFKHALVPNDPTYNQQWHLTRINAPAAWDLSTGSPAITVAIVDDAVRITHQDLDPVKWVNPLEVPGNGVDDDGNGYIDDIHGWDVAGANAQSPGDNDPNPPAASVSNTVFTHGTHCAGIAGAASNNGIGIASIGFNIRIIAVKCTYDNDPGPYIHEGYDGVQYAIAARARVISMSWGGTGNPGSFGNNLFNFANSQGIVLVGAAGNDNVSAPFFPANSPHVISVAATDNQDRKASFSNFGSWVDISAPGVNIRSTLAGSNTAYGNQSGTSMACPLVAGLCGLLLSYNPNLTPANVLSCLQTGATNINAINPNYANQLGAGRINAFNTLSCAPPLILDYDVAVSQIVSPPSFVCVGNIQPRIRLYNNGQLTLTSAVVGYRINNDPWATFPFAGNVPQGQTAAVDLPPFTAPVGTHTLAVYAGAPNGQQDQNPFNDTIRLTFIVMPPAVGLPFTENFESNSFSTNSWSIDNPDNSTTWTIRNAGGNPPGTRSAHVNLYNYNSQGQRDGLVSRPINLQNYTSANLTLSHAYRRYSQNFSDSLIIYVSTDCGTTFQRVFTNGGGPGFATGFITNQNFVPSSSNDWCFDNTGCSQCGSCISVNLTPFCGQQILVRFESYNAYGNNLYIDDINIVGTAAAPVAQFTSNATTVCVGQAVQFQNTSAAVGIPSYLWTFAGGTPSSSTQANPSVTYSSPGTYSVSLTVTDANGTNTRTVENYITVVSGAQVNVSAGDATLCLGAGTTLTATGADFYSWAPATGLSNTVGPAVTAAPTQTTTYTVTGYLGAPGQCPATNVVTVEIFPNPEIAVLPATAYVCDATTALLTASGAQTYTWAPAQGLSSTSGPVVTASPSQTTVYTVTGTSANGCVSTQTVTVHYTGGALSLPFREDFESNSLQTNGWTVVNPDNSFGWEIRSNIGGNPPGNRSCAARNFLNSLLNTSEELISRPIRLDETGVPYLSFKYAYRPRPAGNADRLTVRLSTDCGATFPHLLFDAAGDLLATNTGMEQAFVPQNVNDWCNDESETPCFRASLENFMGQTVLVKFTSFNPGANPLNNNIYIDDIHITTLSPLAPLAQIHASQTSACVGRTVVFTNVGPNAGGANHLWSFPGGSPSSATGNVVSVMYPTPGTYSVSLTVSNAHGYDTQTLDNYIVVHPLPVITVDSDRTAVCRGEEVRLEAFGGSSYEWFAPGGFWAQGQSIVVSPTESTMYTVVGLSSAGCPGDRSYQIFVQHFVPDFGVVGGGDTVQVHTPVEFEDRTPGATRRTWDFGGGAIYETRYVTHTFTQTGTAEVILITGSELCSTADTLRLTVISATDRNGPRSADEVKVYPNPSDGKLWIACDTPLEAKLYNALGAMAATTSVVPPLHAWRLPGHLADGLYLLRLETPRQIREFKVWIRK